MTFQDFVNKDLIHFSTYDTCRSIPSAVDGLKISQRKVLYSCFKMNLTSEVKVGQLSGYVAGHSAYHHGEASLQGTIIGMAQDYVGSNNINLLEPIGQFGTRLAGGADSASPRYIHTRLEDVARLIFRSEDDPILTYLEDDGQSVEPVEYLPVIPFVLVNGAMGIGTGYSTSVPCYNPRHIIRAVRLAVIATSKVVQTELAEVVAEEEDHLKPWYRGFKGEITEIGTRGVFFSLVQQQGRNNSKNQQQIANNNSITMLRITELPIGVWTDDFKVLLEAYVQNTPEAKSFTNSSEDINEIDFTVTYNNNNNTTTTVDITSVEKELKLANNRGVSTSNMHLFDTRGRIKKYATPNDIITDFIPVRLRGYEARRAAQLTLASRDLRVLEGKIRFLDLVTSSKLELHKIADDDFDNIANAHGLAAIDGSRTYLTSMPMSSMTRTRMAALEKTRADKAVALEELKAKTPQDLWIADLDALDAYLSKQKQY